jgi:hypothetical protein
LISSVEEFQKKIDLKIRNLANEYNVKPEFIMVNENILLNIIVD